MKKWKVIESKFVFDNKWFKVQQDSVELSNGKIIDDFFMWKEGPIGVAVALTAENEILLVREYRHAAGEILIQLPAGILNEGEDYQAGSLRELEEETGYSSKEVEPLATLYRSPSKIIGTVSAFLMKNCYLLEGERHLDETEDIELVKMPFSEALKLIDDGVIVNSDSIALILMAARKLNLR
jgi:8-oxo-dGTP pyrophosphatase MutT (NUDIX family)